jgi:hypothetical protein
MMAKVRRFLTSRAKGESPVGVGVVGVDSIGGHADMKQGRNFKLFPAAG